MNRYEEALAEVSEPSRVSVTYWKPKPGEVIGGKVRFIGDRETSFGDQLTIEIQSDSGEVFARAVNRALESELRLNNVDEDDVVALKYLGQRVAATSGRNYNTYAVRRLETGQTGSADSDDQIATEKLSEDLPF